MSVAALNHVMLPAIVPVYFPPEHPRCAIVGVHKVSEFEAWLHRHGIAAFIVTQVRLATRINTPEDDVPQISRSYRLFTFEHDKDIVYFKLGFG